MIAEERLSEAEKNGKEDSVPEPKISPEPPKKQVEEKKASKKLLDDWGDDDDGEASSPDPDISFKDDSLVMKSPKGNTNVSKPLAALEKAATVSTSEELEKELRPSTSSSEFSKPSTGVVTKKRSIFKSKNKEDAGAKKGLSLYKHKWTHDKEEDKDEFKQEVFKRAVYGSSKPSQG